MNEIAKAPNRGNVLLLTALTASLLANLAMGTALGRRPRAPARAAAPVLTAHAASPFWRAPRPPSQVRADLSRFAGVWARLEARDYGALVQNLRAVGCPEGAVRNIVIPRIDADFEKRKELELPKALMEISPTRRAWQFKSEEPPLALLKQTSLDWPSLTFLLEYDREDKKVKGLVKAERAKLRHCRVTY